ncbi:MAG TPA: YciI family protein [Acetobacteraceae bacterium]|nr:YciI family protein [Acetobacteraceae bacterium]
MRRLFAVIRSRGPSWDPARRMEDQPDSQSHAAFMNALQADGFVVLVGPLEGTPDVLLIARADSAEQVSVRLADDPWVGSGHLRIAQVAPWTLRLGTLGEDQRR